MPIYEYTCGACQRRFQKLVGVVASSTPLQCPHCASTEVHRRISRFARVRSEDDALDALAEDLEAAGDTDDPRAMRRLMREIGKEMGEDLDDEFEQMLEEEAGSEEESATTDDDTL
ncbi:MAG: zinc ribbon domain-containing protein [Chloroherpetonaceae bacterium]|nr:zinc ribbon domain-containing protein [Chthonomonadaceae bacterium]MDW8208908.1 zinc ribbon domain-containing protein [Chloroherpetonaceae bacterium]